MCCSFTNCTGQIGWCSCEWSKRAEPKTVWALIEPSSRSIEPSMTVGRTYLTAVSLLTYDSETALRVMLNFQTTLNQWRGIPNRLFLGRLAFPQIWKLTFEYVFVAFCLISRSWGRHFLNMFLNSRPPVGHKIWGNTPIDRHKLGGPKGAFLQIILLDNTKLIN